MFEADILYPHYTNLLGWKQHYDALDFQIEASLTTSETGEFYQQKHPAMDLAVIRSILPKGRTLDGYLTEKVKDSIAEMFNDVLQYRQVNNYGKTLLQNATLLNKIGWKNDTIVNQNRFVGFQIRLKATGGLKLTINEIGTQFEGVDNFNLYLFHSSKEDYIKKIEVTTSGNFSWKWQIEQLVIEAFNSEEYYGGAFVLGYYQEDLTTVAVNYSNFDWNIGECSLCSPSRHVMWNSIAEYFHIFPLYVPQGSFVKEKMFNLQEAFFVSDQSFGLNLRLSVNCDLTQFFIDNKIHFKNLLAIKVVHKVLYDMKFSQQTNYIEENLKMMIIRDLEGDKETNYLNTLQQYNREMKAIQYNIGGINDLCLPCEETAYVPTVGSM